MRRWLLATSLIVMGFGDCATAQAQEAKAALKDANEAYVAAFRESGTTDAGSILPVLTDTVIKAASLDGIERIEVDIEIARTYRLLSNFAEAAPRYEAAAHSAIESGHPDLAFEAAIGAARSYQFNGDVGRAAVAYALASEVAGPQPTPKQAHDLIIYGVQLEADRGELEAALVGALETATLATEPIDRFYAAFEVAGAYQSLVASCDYMPIEDARSRDDDPYGACRRAADAGERTFADAAAQADALGWHYIASQARGMMQSFQVRRMTIGLREREHSWGAMGAFEPKEAGDVLVNQNFIGQGAPDANMALLAQLADRAAASAGGTGVSALGLQGDAALARGQPQDAIQFYEQAAQRLELDRSGYFDPRRRGTVIERYTSALVNRALTQLQLGMFDEAFASLEAMRSRGLSELAAALASPSVSEDDRAWLARLTRVEAQLSGVQNRVVRRAIAEGANSLADSEVKQFDELRHARYELLSDKTRRMRFEGANYRPADLGQLRAAVKRSGIPVLLYWVTPTNVVGWLETPNSSRVLSIFLPGKVASDRVRRVRATASQEIAFDADAARQLYLFLIAPFDAELGSAAKILIVPQGELTDLPFEALIAPDGRYLIESRSVGYATNATFAVDALSRDGALPMRVAVIYDEVAEVLAGNVAAIERSASVEKRPASTIDVSAAGQFAASAPILHVLAHGTFDYDEPLLSRIKLGSDILAADIVGWQLDGTELAVFSACESGVQGRLLSNELFGIPWALAAAGVRNVVVSRWLLPQEANARWVPAYYSALAHGKSPSEAAADVAREMLGSGDRHPRSWAAMQVIGR